MSATTNYLLLCLAMQIYSTGSVILQGCGQRDMFEEQLHTLSLEEVWEKTSGRQACCPAKPIGGYFFHVPKCGGTSTRKMLQSYMEAAGFTHCQHNDNKQIVGEQYYNCVASIPDKQRYLDLIYKGRFLNECSVIASHNDATLFNRLDVRDDFGNKQLLDIIILREPVARHLSELRFQHVNLNKQDISIFDDPERRSNLLAWMDRTDNLITKLLSGFYGCYDFSGPLRHGDLTETDVKQALINLSQFCAIVILEQPQCGLARLNSAVNSDSSNLVQFPHINPAGTSHQFNEEFVAKANQTNLYDSIIYKYALELNKQQCEQLGIEQQVQ